MNSDPSGISGVRWIRFNLIGAMGFGVQLGMLAFLTTLLHVEYTLATPLAVESSVLHNFVWHERFTWADRSSGRWGDVWTRALRFNLTTGVVSIGGNLLFMRVLVGDIHLPALFANLVSVAACSVANFLVSDRWVFPARPGPAMGTTRHV